MPLEGMGGNGSGLGTKAKPLASDRRRLCCLSRRPVQLALRISSTSVTVITPGAGCSITSTATVSTTGVTGGFTFRAAFFTGAGLGFALATVRFAGAALAALRALPRLAELRSFARFCTFDAFLRLAMIRPRSGWWSATHDVGSKRRGNGSSELSPDFSLSANALALFFLGRTGAIPSLRGRIGVKARGALNT
jgi:hypothetical protein